MFKKTVLILAQIVWVSMFFTHSLKAQKAPDFNNNLVMDNKTYIFFMADRLEFYNVDGKPILLDAQGYIGKDLNKFWFKAEGEVLTSETEGELEFQGLYSKAISPYFDLQTGLRYDIAYSDVHTQKRGFVVIGIQGLAPYLFEIDGSLFVSESGDISASFEAEYDFPITQRLWAQPRIAANAALHKVETWGIGSGLNDLQLGFRLRYEIKKEFAPYLGISWNHKVGQTANFFETAKKEMRTLGLLGGLRFWF